MNLAGGLARATLSQPAWRALLLAVAVAILLLASALRFHRLGEQSLWYDEGVAYAHSLRTLPELIPLLQRNVHVPAYFSLLGWWQDLTGSSEFALRALSALFSIASVAWAFALGRRLYDPLAGLTAAALVTLNSFSIYYAQEARMYAMLTALAGASMWLFSGLLRARAPARGRWVSLLALGLINALGLYTHVAFALVVAAQAVLTALWLGGNWRGQRAACRALPQLTQVVLANLLTLLLFLPWLPVALRQLQAQPNLSQAVAADELLRQLLGVLAVGITFQHSTGHETFAVVFLLVFGSLLAAGRPNRLALLPAIWALVSVGIYLHLELTTRYLALSAAGAVGIGAVAGDGRLDAVDAPQPRLAAAGRARLPKLAAAVALGALLLDAARGAGRAVWRP